MYLHVTNFIRDVPPFVQKMFETVCRIYFSLVILGFYFIDVLIYFLVPKSLFIPTLPSKEALPDT